MPIAEETGLVAEIDHWMVDAALRVVGSDPRFALDPELRVAVNVSGRTLERSDFVARLNASLDLLDADPHRLAIEITETCLLDDDGGTLATLRSLRARGITVCIDDFGTGYSALSYLQTFQVDVLKVDQAFVAALESPGEQARATLTAIITMAHALGLVVVAEGVETDAQRDTLVSLGCDWAQGWHYGRPVPPPRAPADLPLPRLDPSGAAPAGPRSVSRSAGAGRRCWRRADRTRSPIASTRASGCSSGSMWPAPGTTSSRAPGATRTICSLIGAGVSRSWSPTRTTSRRVAISSSASCSSCSTRAPYQPPTERARIQPSRRPDAATSRGSAASPHARLRRTAAGSRGTRTGCGSRPRARISRECRRSSDADAADQHEPVHAGELVRPLARPGHHRHRAHRVAAEHERAGRPAGGQHGGQVVAEAPHARREPGPSGGRPAVVALVPPHDRQTGVLVEQPVDDVVEGVVGEGPPVREHHRDLGLARVGAVEHQGQQRAVVGADGPSGPHRRPPQPSWTRTGAWSDAPLPLRSSRSIAASVTRAARAGEASTKSIRMPSRRANRSRW